MINEFEIFRAQNTALSSHFVSNFFFPSVKQLAFPRSEYLGSIGGLLGLFAGISVISLIEMAFFMIQASLAKLMRFQNRRSTHEITVVAPINVVSGKKTVFGQLTTFFLTIVNKSDVHGLHYIVEKDKKLSERLFWLATVLVSSAVCLSIVFDLVKHTELNPIEYVIDQKMWNVKDVRNFRKNRAGLIYRTLIH